MHLPERFTQTQEAFNQKATRAGQKIARGLINPKTAGFVGILLAAAAAGRVTQDTARNNRMHGKTPEPSAPLATPIPYDQHPRNILMGSSAEEFAEAFVPLVDQLGSLQTYFLETPIIGVNQPFLNPTPLMTIQEAVKYRGGQAEMHKPMPHYGIVRHQYPTLSAPLSGMEKQLSIYGDIVAENEKIRWDYEVFIKYQNRAEVWAAWPDNSNNIWIFRPLEILEIDENRKITFKQFAQDMSDNPRIVDYMGYPSEDAQK